MTKKKKKHYENQKEIKIKSRQNYKINFFLFFMYFFFLRLSQSYAVQRRIVGSYRTGTKLKQRKGNFVNYNSPFDLEQKFKLEKKSK